MFSLTIYLYPFGIIKIWPSCIQHLRVFPQREKRLLVLLSLFDSLCLGWNCVARENLPQIINGKHNEPNWKTYVNFTDFINAFDNVDRNKLFVILLEAGVPNQIRVICKMYNSYTENVISVKSASHLSYWKPINQGVWKGCELSL